MGTVKERDTAHLSGLRFVVRSPATTRDSGRYRKLRKPRGLRSDERIAFSGSITPNVGRIKPRGDLWTNGKH